MSSALCRDDRGVEWTLHRTGLGGRPTLGQRLGEAYWYYWLDPANGNIEIKVAYLKRVLAHGVPLLVGSGVYSAGAAPPGAE